MKTRRTRKTYESQLQIPAHTGPEGLDEFAEKCAEDLFAEVQHQFIYPRECSLQHWPIDEIKKGNDTFLKSLRGRANVYAKSIGLRDRLTQHLICRHPNTGSMLEAVRTAVAAGEHIGISLIKVQPESLRLFVEKQIISTHKSTLAWNTHG